MKLILSIIYFIYCTRHQTYCNFVKRSNCSVHVTCVVTTHTYTHNSYTTWHTADDSIVYFIPDWTTRSFTVTFLLKCYIVIYEILIPSTLVVLIICYCIVIFLHCKIFMNHICSFTLFSYTHAAIRLHSHSL